MEIERKRLGVLQTAFKFLEKIQSNLPYNLALECSHIKEAMTCVGASPNYINILADPDAHKTTLERKKRIPLIVMNTFRKTKSKDSNGDESSRTKKSPELDHIIKTSSPINMHQQSQSIPTNLKTSFSPISNSPYSNIFRLSSEPRNVTKISSTTGHPRICDSPLPSIPIIERDNLSTQPSICTTPLPHTPTHAVKVNTPAPKKQELIGDDVTFILGTSPTTPECYTQCNKRVPHNYINIVEDKNKSAEYQNTRQEKHTRTGVNGYIPKKRQIIPI